MKTKITNNLYMHDDNVYTILSTHVDVKNVTIMCALEKIRHKYLGLYIIYYI